MSTVAPRVPPRTFATLALLTTMTGPVDAASVLGLGHVFTANMTGNVVFIGFRLAGAGETALGASLAALGAFLLGALVGGRVTRTEGRFKVAIGLVAGLLLVASVLAALASASLIGRAGILSMLASAMGMQNAAVRRLGIPDMTTTVLTLTLTGLAADSRIAGGDAPRVGRRFASVLLMLIGATFGALLLPLGTPWPIGVAALLAVLAWTIAE